MTTPNPIEALAAVTFTPIDGAETEQQQAQEQAAQEQQQQAAQSLAKAEAFVINAVTFLGCVGRDKLAKKLPAIREEWPNEIFEEPARALLPLLGEHMAKLAAKVGENDKLLALGMALAPLGMGAYRAWEKAQQTVDVQARPVTSTEPEANGSAS